jgi:hypothetical protein
MKLATLIRTVSLTAFVLASLALSAPGARAQCCVVPDVNGTAQVPPACPDGYIDSQAVKLNGLPPGEPVFGTLSIVNIHNVVEGPGGGLGGTSQTWDAILMLHLVGSPPFVYDRTFSIQVNCSSDAAPRLPFTPIQSFNMELVHLQGQLPPGDPDFDLLRITAGSGFGMPSPGHTTLVQAAGGWSVDSFFDITYRIDYIGHPGGPFGGYSNSQTETLQPFDMCHSRPTAVQPSTWGAVKSLYR